MDIHTATKDLFQNIGRDYRPFITLKQGEIFFASIQKIYPNQHAEVRLGPHKLIARLEVPLEIGKGYFLQVESNQGEPSLKLIGTNQGDSRSLLRHLSLPRENGYDKLAHMMIKEPVSLTEEQIEKAGQWINESRNKETAMDAIRLMLHRQLPFSENVFNALAALSDKQSFTDLILQLKKSLILEKDSDPLVQKLLNLLDELGRDSHQRANYNGFHGEQAASLIRRAIKQIGLFYESEIMKNNMSIHTLDSLKPQLVEFLSTGIHQRNSPISQTAEQLLLQMNGQQLLSMESGPVQQIMFDIPIELFGHRTDVSFQWEGKRRDDGTIDPDYCRIVFYLDLLYLEKTVVDVQIQNRVAMITVINRSSDLKAIASPLIPLLTSNLKKLDYELSAVHFRLPGQNRKKENQEIGPRPYAGVDIQI